MLVFWLVMPFFRGFDYRNVKNSMTNLMRLWSAVLGRILGVEPTVRLSYRNACTNLERFLLRI